jgi:3-hydroxyisobutyrate dehydrogenase
MNVGFIGLGNMGLPMAGRLADAGHDVAVFDLVEARMDALARRGARVAASPADAANGVDVVGIAVMDGPQVEAVALGDDGVLAGASTGAIVAVHSTVHPSTVRHVASAAGTGVAVLDAPISGGVEGARNGTLCVMVGGDATAFARARPAFDAFGDLIVHLGALGAGLAAKLARNLIGYVSLLGAQEGQRLADAGGVDRASFHEILEHTGAISPMMRDMLSVRGGDRVYSEDLQPLIDLATKDLRVITEFARDLRVELPGATVTLEHAADAIGPREVGEPT